MSPPCHHSAARHAAAVTVLSGDTTGVASLCLNGGEQFPPKLKERDPIHQVLTADMCYEHKSWQF